MTDFVNPNIRLLPKQIPRVETGPTRFGDDWCGVFIRGDQCHGYGLWLKRALDELKAIPEKDQIEGHQLSVEVLERFIVLLASTDEV